MATKMASQMKAEAEAQEAQNATTMKAEAEVSPEGLADKTTTDKTSPILNDLGPVALPRIGKKERFSKPCPRHRQVGHRAGKIQLCAKPINCGCCMGTCQLCEFAKLQRSLTSRTFHTSKPFYCELYPHCGCDPTQDYLGLTTDSDLAFGADPFGDGAASDDLPQLESQPDSEGDAGWVAMLE